LPTISGHKETETDGGNLLYYSTTVSTFNFPVHSMVADLCRHFFRTSGHVPLGLPQLLSD